MWISERIGRRLGLVAALVVAFVSATARAELPKSLDLVPQDAAYYGSTLRLGEQFNAFVESNAYQWIRQMPAVEEAVEKFKKEMEGEDNPAQALQSPIVQQYLKFAGDLVKDEIFVYGSQDTAATLKLINIVSNKMRFASLESELQDSEDVAPEERQAREILETIQANLNLLVVPDFLLAFKPADVQQARDVLAQLEFLMGVGFAQLDPKYQKAFKRQKLGEGDFLTITVDGSMIPWDEAGIPEGIMKDYQRVFDRVKESSVVVALGVSQGYFIFSIGDTTEHLASLGQGAKLLDHPKLAKLREASDQRLTGINYVSESFLKAVATTPEDIDAIVEYVKQGILKEVDIPEELQKRIGGDVKKLADEIKPVIMEPGAMLHFSYITEAGSESFSYNWSQNPLVAANEKLPILEHLGGSPLVAIARRATYQKEIYDFLRRWAVVGFGYFEDYGVPELSEEEQEEFKKFQKLAGPLIKRGDHIIVDLVLPALEDGQRAVVLDADWTSKQWHKEMPPSETPLPMLQIGLIWGVSDADKMRQAFREGRDLFNDAYNVAQQENPEEVPPFQLPDPRIETAGTGTLYIFDIPAESGLDEQIKFVIGLSDDYMVCASSEAHAKALLKKTKFQGPAPLDKSGQELAMACVFNWADMVEAAKPWVDYAMTMEETPEEIMDQVHTGLKVAQVFKSCAWRTYVQDGVIVSHTQCHIVDLPAPPKKVEVEVEEKVEAVPAAK